MGAQPSVSDLVGNPEDKLSHDEACHISRFKMKVGSDLQDDIRRAKDFRNVIGYDRIWVKHITFQHCLLLTR